jgi:undecaprenyl diphosphate synthase
MQSSLHKKLHIALIMDGNGRWATRRGLPRTAGHRAGVAAVRRVVECAPDLGIGTLTLYAFSSDNWRRPAGEVDAIFWLLRAYLRMETEKLRHRGARLSVIGRRDRLPELLKREIAESECATAAGCRLHLRIAVDYSSRDAIARAVSALGEGGQPQRPLSTDQLGRMLSHALTSDAGEVDLLIRTGGEMRLSDFLLWESAYAELLFTEGMWPDFGAADLEEAVRDFHGRERRFGGLSEAAQNSFAPSSGGGR